MGILFELLIRLASLILVMIYLVGLLFVMLISVVYVVGYAYDSIFGDFFIRFGQFIAKKYPRIKSNVLAVKA